MTTHHQQILLQTTLLIGTLLIGIWVYRPVPPAADETPALEPVQSVATQPIEIPPETPETIKSPVPPLPRQRPMSVKKAQFFERLIPLIEQENEQTLQVRASILQMRVQLEQGETLTEQQQQILQRLTKRYRLRGATTTELTRINQLLVRIDMLPPSLALAQAANESAWGESRFAREANNLYGQWCFTAGCGLIPRHRPEGMTHEVASYPSWQASVSAYFLNVNSHPAYQPLRDIRQQRRQQNLVLSGELLAAGLEKYSARGAIYVDSLQRIIRVNDLTRLDQL